jgi:hypothetical protein
VFCSHNLTNELQCSVVNAFCVRIIADSFNQLFDLYTYTYLRFKKATNVAKITEDVQYCRNVIFFGGYVFIRNENGDAEARSNLLLHWLFMLDCNKKRLQDANSVTFGSAHCKIHVSSLFNNPCTLI